MAQVSRPFQIALAVVVLFAAVWFVALQGHSSSSSSTPVASTPVSTSAPATAAKAPAGTTHIEGMTRAVTHAHEAVAASQRAADKSAGASAEAPSQGASATASSTTVVTKHSAGGASTTVATKHGATGASTAVVTKHSAAGTSTTVVTKHGAAGASTTVVAKHVTTPTPAPHKVVPGAIPAQQAAVESELKRGEVAVVLFWNKQGADDVAVHEELQILLAAHHEVAVHPNKAQVRKLRLATGLELEKKIAVHYATAAQVTSFGSFTKTIQVYGTPTILIVNKHGAVTTINGLTDAFAIEQTIDEARQES
jgi:hypothetical protein